MLASFVEKLRGDQQAAFLIEDAFVGSEKLYHFLPPLPTYYHRSGKAQEKTKRFESFFIQCTNEGGTREDKEKWLAGEDQNKPLLLQIGIFDAIKGRDRGLGGLLFGVFLA